MAAVPEIDRAVRATARLNGLRAAEAEDLASDVKLRFIENDYAALRKFDGRSSLRTYIVTIVHRLIVDRRRKEWGRFRPSAQAIARGPVAERLERLLYCDGLTLDEAIKSIRASTPGEDHEVLLGIAYALPVRSPTRRPAGDDGLARVPAPESANPEIEVAARAAAHRAQALITSVLHRLPPIDRIVLRLRFEDGVSTADIARMLRLDQKRLYRRVEDLLRELRRDLEGEGLAWQDMQEMFDRGQCHIRLALEDAAENGLSRPSEQRVHG